MRLITYFREAQSSRLALGVLLSLPLVCAAAPAGGDTRTPIKHLIVIIGENRSFDHVFATYRPKNGETVWNLLSQGIVDGNGKPGPNFAAAEQRAAANAASDAFLLSPAKTSFPNEVLPAPLVGGPERSYVKGDSLSVAKESENGLPEDYYPYLLTGGTGLPSKTPDTRIDRVNSLPPGPFQLTNGKTFVYDSYAASPIHRFYQMWQQLDCSLEHASRERPSGCDSRLFSWVEISVGEGANGLEPPANFSVEYSPAATTTGEGSAALGFYNMQHGDVPYFKGLADAYAMSDNFHQSVNGGTGANHIMLGHGDVLWFSDGAGHPAVPPHRVDAQANANASAEAKVDVAHGGLDEVENPDPMPGTHNWYSQDGYGGGSSGAPVFGGSSGLPPFGGGSYSNCADHSQPGVAAIVSYLQSLPRPIDPHCEAGRYYLLNNYNPGYFGDGSNAYTDTNAHNTPFTLPPSSTRSIGDSLLEKHVSWKYYGAHWNNYMSDPYQLNAGAIGPKSDDYCNVCNPFQYDTSIMTNAAQRRAHLKDTADLYADIAKGTLPAVAFVKPSTLVDGHPDSSKLNLFEGFSKKIIDAVRANPGLWKDTAIFVTFDEGGGYYDSGYVQPLDFFGDGTRIPLIVVSRYTEGGHISHEYADHVSILKFIERNWRLPPITQRSRDNFPNPIANRDNPYAPRNTPAISDLFDLFAFKPGRPARD